MLAVLFVLSRFSGMLNAFMWILNVVNRTKREGEGENRNGRLTSSFPLRSVGTFSKDDGLS